MIDISSLEIRQLTADMPLLPFHCADKDLNDFLVQDAKNYLEDMMAVTYVVIDTKKNQTAAYFSLLNDKVAYDPQSKGIWNRINRHIHNNKRRRSYPAIKLCRLGVDESVRGHQVGSNIIKYIKTLYALNDRAGCRFLTVDAYNAAVPFYELNGFLPLGDSTTEQPTKAMFFDLNDIEKE